MAIAPDMPSTQTTSFWHPFADMGAVSQAELVIERGEGVHVFDAEGSATSTATASLWYANLGHGRAEVTRAVAAQMDRLRGLLDVRRLRQPARRTRSPRGSPRSRRWTTPRSSSPPAAATRSTPPPRSRAATGCRRAGPSASTSSAARTATTARTRSARRSAGSRPTPSNWGPLVPHTSAVPHDSLPALEDEILRVGPERVAAFFCEPVIGAGGVHPPAEGYIEGVADLCAEHGILLVIDSVICAFGRLGTWFGIERWPDVRPDMITFAKGVTSGYLPLGGVIVSGRWRRRSSPSPAARCCATARRTPATRPARRRARGARRLRGRGPDPARPAARAAAERRARAARRAPAVGEVRAGLGLLGAVQLSDDALAADPGAVAKVAGGARAAGVLVRPLLRGVAVSPPLIVDESHLEEMAAAIRAGLERL